MIGIIGYGMVGKAVEYGFSGCSKIISDPKYNTITIKDVCDQQPEAIFVSVPTPTDETGYSLLRHVLDEIKDQNYQGLTVVKSTVLAHYVKEYDIVFNPEFLSRATAQQDFVRPPMMIFGGPLDKTHQLAALYKKYSTVETSNVFHTDLETATLLKYAVNSFYALKVTYMNTIYDIAQTTGADYKQLVNMMEANPWMGTHHFQVPGPDGLRGFGGPCLPKDTEAMVKEFDVEILKTVLKLNSQYRK